MTICEPGNYCINGVKKPCPAYTFGTSSGLVSDKCDGVCGTSQKSSASRTMCECVDTFVETTENTTDGDVLSCTCPAGAYMSEKSARCETCPSGRVKAGNGTSILLCQPEEISTTYIILFGLFAFAGLMFAFIFHRLQKSENIYEASSIAFSNVSIAIASMLSEIVDFISDAVACYNVFASANIGEERNLYLGFTIVAGIVFTLGFSERIANLRWQIRRFSNKQVRKKKTKTNKVRSEQDGEEEDMGAVSSHEEDDLVEVEHDIKGIRVRGIILIGVDVPMIAMNAYILNEYKFVDTAIIVSLLFSAFLAGTTSWPSNSWAT